jgi:hypothetical protein
MFNVEALKEDTQKHTENKSLEIVQESVQFNKANNHVGAYDLLVGVSVRINIAK